MYVLTLFYPDFIVNSLFIQYLIIHFQRTVYFFMLHYRCNHNNETQYFLTHRSKLQTNNACYFYYICNIYIIPIRLGTMRVTTDLNYRVGQQKSTTYNESREFIQFLLLFSLQCAVLCTAHGSHCKKSEGFTQEAKDCLYRYIVRYPSNRRGKSFI